jgi:hypothetical protein
LADPLRDVSPGDPPGRLLNSSTFNLQMAVARWYRDNVSGAGRRAGAGEAQPFAEVPPRVEVRIKPESSVPEYGIVTLGAALIIPEDAPVNAAQTPIFEAGAPVAGGALAVCLAPIDGGKIGRAAVLGVVVCDVEVTDTGHQFADLEAGNLFNMVSAETGPARLLHVDGTGTYKTLVLLQGDMGGGTAAVSAWKEPVRVATTANGTLASAFENGDSVDGVTLATGDRILLKNQSSASENGIYTVNASGAPTRASDADGGAELLGAAVAVTEGTANADTVWLCTANATISVGSTSLPWVKIGPSSAGAIDGSGAADKVAVWTDSDTLTHRDAYLRDYTGVLGTEAGTEVAVFRDTGADVRGEARLFGYRVGSTDDYAGVNGRHTAGTAEDGFRLVAYKPAGSSDSTAVLLHGQFGAAKRYTLRINETTGPFMLFWFSSADMNAKVMVSGVFSVFDGITVYDGVSGTLKAGATATGGIVTSLGTLTSAYTTTNVTTDRSYDANATTLDELADVLGTLIADLKAKSILG